MAKKLEQLENEASGAVGCLITLVLVGVLLGVLLFLADLAGWGFFLIIGTLLGAFALWGYWLYLKSLKADYFARQQTLSQLRAMSPSEFEDFLVWLFEQYGYTVKKTARKGDHGVDLILYEDGKVYAVQAKRFREGQNIGEPMLREFYGAFEDYNAQEGYFVTTSDFTRSAREWAARRCDRLHLINGDELVAMVCSLKR